MSKNNLHMQIAPELDEAALLDADNNMIAHLTMPLNNGRNMLTAVYMHHATLLAGALRELVMAINEHTYNPAPENCDALRKTVRGCATFLNGLEILAKQNIAASCQPISFTAQKTETLQ